MLVCLKHVQNGANSRLSDFIKRELGRIAERPGMADALKRDLSQRDDSFIVPHLLDVEAASGLRLLVAGQRVDSHRMEQLLAGLATLPAERYAHAPLLPRIWELRHNFTCYDAAYIALAEATDSVLYTTDVKLSKGHRARVMVFTR